MSKFGNYEALKPVNVPRRFEFSGLAPSGGDEPFMMILPADEMNPAFLDLALARAGDPKSPKVDINNLDAAGIEAQRQIDMEVIAKSCVTGWGNVVDMSAKKVAFSPNEALDFFNAIPRSEFDRLRAFCRNLRNFTPAIASAQGVELGKAVARGSSGTSNTRRKRTA